MSEDSVVIIGAGQAGLGMARALQKHGVNAEIIDERTEVGGAWGDYYESLKLFSPAAYSSLPDLPFPEVSRAVHHFSESKNGVKLALDHKVRAQPRFQGNETRSSVYPDAPAVTEYLKAYAQKFAIRPTFGERVMSVQTVQGGFQLKLSSGQVRTATALVVATGTFGAPNIPHIQGEKEFGGRQLHSSAYKRADAFSGQRVVVVGAANSAVQIAYDLVKTAASITLAARKPVKFVPQKILGQDIHFWFSVLGVDRAKGLSDQGTPVIDDGTYKAALASATIRQKSMFTEFTDRGVVWADGTQETVDTVIFATGFSPDLAFLTKETIGAKRLPAQRDGASEAVPGLYFVGQPGLRNFASGTLRGVCRDASVVAKQIARFLEERHVVGAKSVTHWSRKIASS